MSVCCVYVNVVYEVIYMFPYHIHDNYVNCPVRACACVFIVCTSMSHMNSYLCFHTLYISQSHQLSRVCVCVCVYCVHVNVPYEVVFMSPYTIHITVTSTVPCVRVCVCVCVCVYCVYVNVAYEVISKLPYFMHDTYMYCPMCACSCVFLVCTSMSYINSYTIHITVT